MRGGVQRTQSVNSPLRFYRYVDGRTLAATALNDRLIVGGSGNDAVRSAIGTARAGGS